MQRLLVVNRSQEGDGVSELGVENGDDVATRDDIDVGEAVLRRFGAIGHRH